MASAVFEVCRMLESAHIHYFIEREPGDRELAHDSDCIRLTASLVGERLEITIFEDDHIELARFPGSESIVGGMELLRELVRRETEAC